MKITVVLFALITFIAVSCNKKFNHQTSKEVNYLSSCTLCTYADSLEGSYRGKWTDHFFYPADSATLILEHIYLSLGNPIDSSQMFFRKTTDFDNHPTRVDTISLTNNSATFYLVNNDSLWIDQNNVIHQHHWFSNPWAYYPEILFDGMKQ